MTPARWAAFTALGIACLSTACSHSAPFSNPPGNETPFDPGPPARLTVSPGLDRSPSWLPDGSGIIYSAQQITRPDIDLCLAELPPTGGSHRRLVCDVPGGIEETDAIESAVASPGGRLALLSAGNGAIGGTNPVFVGIALTPTLDAGNAETVRSLPFTPAGGVAQDFAGHLRWISEDALVYLGQRFQLYRACPPPACPLDTLLLSTEATLLDVAGSSGIGTAIPGTVLATGVAATISGDAVLYTLQNDSRIYRRHLASGDVSVAHDFGAAGVARDLHVGGERVVAVVGGRVAFSVDPTLGPTQWDSGGVLHVVDLGGDDDTVLDTPERLYRRPALSPEGDRVVAEGFDLVISLTGAPDTTVSKNSDLYLFGGP